MSFLKDPPPPPPRPPSGEEDCKFVIEVREFSKITPRTKDNSKSEGKSINCDMSNKDFKNYYRVLVHPNVRDCDSEECVSIALCKQECFPECSPQDDFWVCHVELKGVLTIIDKDGDRRFPQSKTICYDFVPTEDVDVRTSNLQFDHFVKRRYLLSDPSEWLPNDTLKLHMDAVLNHSYYHSLKYDLQKRKSPEGLEEWYLLLDSPLAKRLAEESDYFRHLQVTPMVEKSSGCVRIPEDEYEWFKTIGRILLDQGDVTFESIDQIFDFYATADKYCITLLMDDCRSWLGLCLSPENAAEISKFADRYSDDRLKCTAEAFPGRSGEDWNAKDNGASGIRKWTLTRTRVGEGCHRLEFTLVYESEPGLDDSYDDEMMHYYECYFEDYYPDHGGYFKDDY